jgi:hypothetical protein
MLGKLFAEVSKYQASLNKNTGSPLRPAYFGITPGPIYLIRSSFVANVSDEALPSALVSFQTLPFTHSKTPLSPLFID